MEKLKKIPQDASWLAGVCVTFGLSRFSQGGCVGRKLPKYCFAQRSISGLGFAFMRHRNSWSDIEFLALVGNQG
jgi:hypothetical protein